MLLPRTAQVQPQACALCWQRPLAPANIRHCPRSRTPHTPAAVFVITSLETVGDVTATEEASFLSTSGASHERRVRGALLNDGINSIFSALVGWELMAMAAVCSWVALLTGWLLLSPS